MDESPESAAECPLAEELCTEEIPPGHTVIGELVALPRRLNLATAEDVRREMARVYREARIGEMDTSEAGRLVYILSQILKAHELGVVEKRIAELGRATAVRRLR